MKIVKLIQGTPEWHAHRAVHFNASEAPAMLGVSQYKARDQLIRETATGITPDVDASTQYIFDQGHRAEALARPLAEKIVGEELYPCVGVANAGKYSASFDGLTLLEDVAFEHKSLNEEIRSTVGADKVISAGSLGEAYRAQMEQQCMVSGAEKVLFMASKWKGIELVEEYHGWYMPDPELRARIVAGWEQFERDVAAYVPTATVAAPAGRAPDTLPALRVEAQGMVTFSNLVEFKASALTVLAGINRVLKTDEDFADADKTVKWCKDVEDRLNVTKTSVLAQMTSVDEVCRVIDDVSAETRRIRLELDKLVSTEKENRRAAIVAEGVEAVRAHYAEINATLGEHALRVTPALQVEIGTAIKGKKTLSSITDAVNAAVASAKIAASQNAERVRQNIAVLTEVDDHAALFPDRVILCESKARDDLKNLVAARINENAKREAERIEHERENIRAEERARIERENTEASYSSVVVADEPPPVLAEPDVQVIRPVKSDARVTLGQINERIAPLSISAKGLEELGFPAIEVKRAAKLYASDDVGGILKVMYGKLRSAIIENDRGAQ